MARVDREALIDSMKALGIIFIISISASSLMLLIKLIRIKSSAFNLRRVVVSILTCGTFLFATFPLIVNVRVQFEPPTVTCTTRLVLSAVYENFFFPFVYAMSLIALAIELYETKTGTGRSNTLPFRIVYIVSPWILAIILVLPLTLAGVHLGIKECYVEDFTIARDRAIVWVCNLFPAIAVLLVAIFLAFKVGGDGNLYADGSSASSSTQRVVQSSSSSSSYGGGGFPHAGYSTNHPSGVVITPSAPGCHHRPDSAHFPHQPPYDYSSPPPSYHSTACPPYQSYHHQPQQNQLSIDVKQQQQHHHHHHHHPHQQQQKQHKQQKQQPQQQQQHYHNPPPQYPPPPPPNYAPPPPGFGTPFYEYDHSRHHHHPHHHPHHSIPQSSSFTQPQVINGSPSNTNTNTGSSTGPIVRDIRNEAKTFVKVAALFAFCSLPQAIFNLAYSMNMDKVEMDVMSQTVISQLVSWIAILRWLLLTICWFVCIKK